MNSCVGSLRLELKSMLVESNSFSGLRIREYKIEVFIQQPNDFMVFERGILHQFAMLTPRSVYKNNNGFWFLIASFCAYSKQLVLSWAKPEGSAAIRRREQRLFFYTIIFTLCVLKHVSTIRTFLSVFYESSLNELTGFIKLNKAIVKFLLFKSIAKTKKTSNFLIMSVSITRMKG